MKNAEQINQKVIDDDDFLSLCATSWIDLSDRLLYIESRLQPTDPRSLSFSLSPSLG